MPHEDDAEEFSGDDLYEEPERCWTCGGELDRWGFCKATCVDEEDGEE